MCLRGSRTLSIFPNVNSGYVRCQRPENHRTTPLKSRHAILATVFLLGEETVLEQRSGFPNCLWNDVNCFKLLYLFIYFFGSMRSRTGFVSFVSDLSLSGSSQVGDSAVERVFTGVGGLRM